MDYEKILEESSLNFLEKLNLEFSNFELDNESQNYNACKFELNNLKIIFRKAKITPTKIGQFVTLWKRKGKNPIEPFSVSDDFNFVIIYVKSQNKVGQFVFPKSILIEKGYISSDKKGGKRGFRVYPIWENAVNKQSIITQKWQLNYFIELPFDEKINTSVAEKYLNLLGIRKL